MGTPFERWFSADWQKMLRDMPDDRTVFSNGQTIQTASWDRRAAYLLWMECGQPEAEWRTKMLPLYRQNPNEPHTLHNYSEEYLPVSTEAVPEPADDLLDLLGDTTPTATVDTDDELEGLLG